MANQPKPPEGSMEAWIPEWATNPSLATLTSALRACGTITELFKLANDDEFKRCVSTLRESQVTELRATYKEMQAALDGKVRLDTFDGQIVSIVGIDWWHSDRFDNGPSGGEGVSLYLRTEREPDKKVKAMTSSAPIVTFCNRLRVPPTEDAPIRVLLSLTPVRDPERAAKGQKVWSIKQLPPARRAGEDGSVPF